MPYGALYGLALRTASALCAAPEPRKLSIAHQPNRHPKHPPKTLQAVSSLIGREMTF